MPLIDIPTEEAIDKARRQLRIRRQMPPPQFVTGMFDLIAQQREKLAGEAVVRAEERSRIASILRSEATGGDHGERFQDGLFLAAQLVEALTDEGIR